MKGKYKIVVYDKRIHYEFEIRRNITIIKGNSATGKTTLIEMIAAYEREGKASGIQINCQKHCVVLDSADWENRIKTLSQSIVFIDEGARFTASEVFAREIRNSDNYYVIVGREGLSNLPYSVDEIYGIRESGKYAGLKKTYNELYRLYGNMGIRELKQVKEILVEDSNAGYDFFKEVFAEKHLLCTCAGGKTRIPGLMKCNLSKKMLVIGDGAAFGCEMEKIARLIDTGAKAVLYLPESFEWLILNSGVVEDSEIHEVMENPYDNIESMRFFSWEQFFTAMLIEKTTGQYLHYSKSKLNKAYLDSKIKGRIMEHIEWLSLLEE